MGAVRLAYLCQRLDQVTQMSGPVIRPFRDVKYEICRRIEKWQQLFG